MSQLSASGGPSIGFSFNISPSNEHPGLISFRMDWLDLYAVQGTLKSLLQQAMTNLDSILKNRNITNKCLSQSVQSLSRVWLSENPWTTAQQASLSITNSQSLPKLMSIESVMPSNHLILCGPLLLLPSIFPYIRIFSNEVCLVNFISMAQSCPTLYDPMNCSTPGFTVHHSWNLLKLMSIESMMQSNHFILRHLLLPPSIIPSITVFFIESVLCIWWPKNWSFSFSISPSSEHPGLISFRMDWLDLLAVQGTLKSLLQHYSSKASILWWSAFFIVQLSHPYMTTGKP